jgi:hypothetical protein
MITVLEAYLALVVADIMDVREMFLVHARNTVLKRTSFVFTRSYEIDFVTFIMSLEFRVGLREKGTVHALQKFHF